MLRACADVSGGVAWPGTAWVHALAHPGRATAGSSAPHYQPGGLLWATALIITCSHGGIKRQPSVHVVRATCQRWDFVRRCLLYWFDRTLADCCAAPVATYAPGSTRMVRLRGLPCIQLFHGSQVVSVGALPPERGFGSALSRGKHQLARLLMLHLFTGRPAWTASLNRKQRLCAVSRLA